MAGDEPSTKPRQLVHSTQAEAVEWQHRLERAMRGLGPWNVERATKEYHSAVMAYYQQIARFRHRKHIAEEWHEESVGQYDCLADLQAKRFEFEEREEAVEDPDTNETQTRTVQDPWIMDPQDALAVHDRLDRCAHKLGFDAEPDTVRESYGAVELDEDDEGGVEVPVRE